MPFLKNRQATQSGLIIKTREPDPSKEEDKDDPAAAIESCAQELIRAVHSKDVKSVAMALKDAFDILDSMPHEEGEHLHDYDSQNQKAAEGDQD